MEKERLIPRFEIAKSIAAWNITNPAYNKLNKLKKTSPEAFYYCFRALEILELDTEN